MVWGMNRLRWVIRTLILRPLWRRPWLSAGSVAAIALGVAVFLAIRIASHSSRMAFSAGVDLVAGRAHLEVRGPDGAGADERWFPLLRDTPGVAGVTPVSEVYALLPDAPGEYLRILGIDVFSNEPFRTTPVTAGAAVEGNLEDWMAAPGRIVVSRAMADRRGWQPGDPVRTQIDGRERMLQVAMVAQGDADAIVRGDEGTRFVTMDIGWLQELTGRFGAVDVLQVRVEGGLEQLDAVEAAIRHRLPAGAEVMSPANRNREVERMLAGFELNLTALSMVSILVGVFLVYNTVSASTVRRRAEIGVLRALGAGSGAVAGLFLGEALLLGVLGALVGVPLAVLLAGGLVGGVSQTISVHYVAVSVDQIQISPTDVAVAVTLGLVSALVGAWRPAWLAARQDPVRALAPVRSEQALRVPTRRLTLAALAVLGGAVLSGWLACTNGPAWLAFACCFMIVSGFALLIPGWLEFVRRHLHPRLAGRPLVRMTAEQLVRSSGRNTITIAAFMAALAMLVGVSVMIHSFRTTVDQWVGSTMQADLYASPAANETVGMQAKLPDEVLQWALGLGDGIAVDTYLEQEATRVEDGRRVTVAVVEMLKPESLPLLQGGAAAWRRWRESDEVIIVSEPLARQRGLSVGRPLNLSLGGREVSFEVVGITRDYSSDQGVAYLRRSAWTNRGGLADGHHSMALHLPDDADEEMRVRLESELRSRFAAAGELAIYSNQTLRGRVLEVFDQTFAVTYVLRAIAVFVGAVGIALGLGILVAERQRETGVLRAIGASPRQVGGLVMGEAGWIGLHSAIAGLACGAALAVALAQVVNRAFFGWTIDMAVPWRELLWLPVWVCALAMAAALVPARRAARVPVAESVRDE